MNRANLSTRLSQFLTQHAGYYLLLIVIFAFYITTVPYIDYRDAVGYATGGSHLYSLSNWGPKGNYANEGYQFLHCLFTIPLGNAPLCRGIAISLVFFMIGAISCTKCLTHFFSLRESQLILLLQLPLIMPSLIRPLTGSVAWGFTAALVWLLLKKEFRPSFTFGIVLGLATVCRNQVLLIFLPLPILMADFSTWKQNWRSLLADLCRCGAGMLLATALFKLFVWGWIENPPLKQSNFYLSHTENFGLPLLALWAKTSSLFLLRGTYAWIFVVCLVYIFRAPPKHFVKRYSVWILLSFALSTALFAVLNVVVFGDKALTVFPPRYFTYFISAAFPLLYYLVKLFAEKVLRVPRIDLTRSTGNRKVKVTVIAVVIALVAFFSTDVHTNYIESYLHEQALSESLMSSPATESEQELLVILSRHAPSGSWYCALCPRETYGHLESISHGDPISPDGKVTSEECTALINSRDLSGYARLIFFARDNAEGAIDAVADFDPPDFDPPIEYHILSTRVWVYDRRK